MNYFANPLVIFVYYAYFCWYKIRLKLWLALIIVFYCKSGAGWSKFKSKLGVMVHWLEQLHFRPLIFTFWWTRVRNSLSSKIYNAGIVFLLRLSWAGSIFLPYIEFRGHSSMGWRYHLCELNASLVPLASKFISDLRRR